MIEKTRKNRLFPVFHAAKPTTTRMTKKTTPPVVTSNGKLVRAISVKVGRLPIYGPPETMERLRLRFDYIFDDPTPSAPSMPRPPS